MAVDVISFWTDIQRYEDMLVADPRSHCFAPLSELYRKLGLLDDAISVARKGCDLHPDYPCGFLALGSACYEKGLAGEARQALERVVALNPEDHRARKLLGQLYADSGETVSARKVLEQVLQQNPDDLESALLLRSLALAGETAQLDEESLEEAEVIEDLTELFDDPLVAENPAPASAAESRQVSAGSMEALTRAATAASIDLAAGPDNFEDAEELWSVEAQEGAAKTTLPPVEDLDSEEPAQAGAFGDTAACAESEHYADSAAFDDSQASSFEADDSLAVTNEPPGKQSARDPLTTATLAELYVLQGFTGKALAIYQELLSADPANHVCRLRCAELSEMLQLQQGARKLATKPAAAPAAPARQEAASSLELDVETELDGWLANIRRRKNGL